MHITGIIVYRCTDSTPDRIAVCTCKGNLTLIAFVGFMSNRILNTSALLAQKITVSQNAHLLAAALIAWQTAFCIDCLTDFLGIVSFKYKHICVACITDYSWTDSSPDRSFTACSSDCIGIDCMANSCI